LTWCDEVLIPAHLLDFYQSLNAKLSIHGLFRREIGDTKKIAKNFLQLPYTNCLLIGSLNQNKYIEAEKFLQCIFS
jgi:hypothetical protein